VGGGDEWSVIIPSYELPNIQWNLKWKVCTRNEKVGQGKKRPGEPGVVTVVFGGPRWNSQSTVGDNRPAGVAKQ
jgi:hypothetical protein